MYLDDGTIVPVPEGDLPIELPDDIDWKQSGNPLDNHPTWKKTIHKKKMIIYINFINLYCFK